MSSSNGLKKKKKIPRGGVRLLDLSSVTLRKTDGAGVNKRKSSGSASGPLVSADQLRSIKLRKVDRSGAPETPTRKPVADGMLDFGEMLKLKLRKAPVDRSPGGTPLKKRPARVRQEPSDTSDYLVFKLNQKFRTVFEDKENGDAGSHSASDSEFDASPVKQLHLEPRRKSLALTQRSPMRSPMRPTSNV